MKNDMIVEIFCDGACSQNGMENSRGGWACLIRRGKQERIYDGEDPDTTNNRMELTAAISALEMLDDRETAVVYSDSQYLVNGITKWVKTWQKNNWVTSSKGRVQNVDLWERLIALRDKHRAQFKWIRGHSTEEIDLVDKYAKERCKNASV